MSKLPTFQRHETFRLPGACYGARAVWAQYRKTFVVTQLTIALITMAVYLGMNRVGVVAAVYLVTMQVGAVAGAAWAVRLKRRVERSASPCPSPSTNE